MTDTKELSKVIQKSGLKMLSVAERMGLSYFGLYKKINNVTEFKASEISRLTEILDLTSKQRDAIFFGHDGD